MVVHGEADRGEGTLTIDAGTDGESTMTSEYVRANRAHWNDDADDYQSRHAAQLDAAPMAWGMWSIPEDMLRVLGQVWDRDVLELGCGAAAWSAALIERGARVVSMDLSERHLAHARRRSNPLRIVQADGECLPYKERRFDTVFCDHGAIGWGDPRRVVPEAARVLRPGGRLVFCVASAWLDVCWDPEADTLGTRLLKPYFGRDRFDEGEGAVSFRLTTGEWLELFTSSGLVVERLVELRPGVDAVSTYASDLEWARNWPMEQLWCVRKRKEPSLAHRVEIRACTDDDLGALESVFTSPGRSRFHDRRLAEQRAGGCVYLIAWLDGVPVGHLNLRWLVSDPTVRSRVQCPEMNALGVARDVQNRGIGTALIEHAEQLCASRDVEVCVIGVDIPNVDARRLYERLGYREWEHGTVVGSWTSLDDHGNEIVHTDETFVLLKRLA